jgi:acyl carrier protein
MNTSFQHYRARSRALSTFVADRLPLVRRAATIYVETKSGRLMTQLTQESIETVVLRTLGRIAPEADLTELGGDVDLREQLDIDSVDFLNFVVALDQELGVDVPEADYAKLRTLDGCVAYLAAKHGR